MFTEKKELELLSKIYQTENFDTVLDIYCLELEKLDYHYYLIEFIDEDQKNLNVLKLKTPEHYSAHQNLFSSQSISLGVKNIRTDAFNRNTIILINKAHIPADYPILPAIFQKCSLHEVASFPLSLHNKVWGVLTILSEHPIQTQPITKLSDIMIYSLKLHYQNYLLKAKESQINQIYNKAVHVFDLAKHINQLSTVQEVYHVISQELMLHYGFDLVMLFIHKNNRLVFEYGEVKNEHDKSKLNLQRQAAQEIDGYPINIAAGGPAFAFITNNQVYMEDFEETKNAYPISEIDQKSVKIWQTIRTVIHNPIREKNLPIGDLALFSLYDKIQLSKTDLNIINSLCDFIGIAISNSGLYHRINEQKIIMQNDLKLAAHIQKKIIPESFSAAEHFKLKICYFPMIEVGGDYYDFYFNENKKNDEFGLIVCDVSGHGVPAAFITSMAKIAFQSKAVKEVIASPAQVLNEINLAITNNIAGNFITASYAYFDFNKKLMKFASAGHPPFIMINRTDKTYSMIKPHGRLLGQFDELELEEIQLPLENNTRFIFYTDGLTEQTDLSGEEFEETLKNIIIEYCQQDLEYFYNIIVDSLKKHIQGKNNYEDDVCMIVMDIT